MSKESEKFADLPDKFVRKRHEYVRELKDGDWMVYRVKPEIGPHWWEIIRAKRIPAREMFGRLVSAHLAYPGDETWGVRGWTVMAREGYDAVLEKLRKKQKEYRKEGVCNES